MKNKRSITWILAAAVASVGFSSLASAQHRVGGDGRALDANNRIGSGGINEGGGGAGAGAGINTGVGGNQIVTGNVTAGQQFRGFVPYTDPFAFRGRTAGINSDRFIRESAGVPLGGGINNNASNLRPFYGQSQTVERPPGFVEAAPGTGYIPSPLLSREAGDLRLGRAFDAPVTRIPQPGQLILPGPVDPNTQQQTVVTASPLYGVRQWNFNEQNDQQFLQGLNVPGAQRSRLDENTLRRMRDELNGTGDAPLGGEQIDPQSPGGGTQQQPGFGNNPFDARQLSLSDDARVSDRVDNRVDHRVNTGFTTQVRPGNLAINTPERQSAQYAEMRRRLDRFNRLPESVQQIEEHRRGQQEALARNQPEKDQATAGGTNNARGARPPGAPGGAAGTGPQQGGTTPAPGAGTDATAGTGTAGTGAQPQGPTLPDMGLPDYEQRNRDILAGREPGAAQDPNANTGTTPGVPGVPGGATAGREPPLRLESFATGVQAKGLADFLKEAERLMKEGKFYSALDQYDLAEQVAPNNPLVGLGRAVAELGASYYARADQHLREAFTRDPALLMAQYDLKSFLGQERLEFVVNDLRAISNRETNEPRSVFLLAFIDYNTGNPRRAAAYLDLAEKRAGKPDPLFQNLRKYWELPAAGPEGAAEDANK